ncbi:hypothetical protein M427DRAFT_75834 [Gonapodya prolifera JEL478]|uniref:Sugar transporter SWEET1 n=1 Tax=Gonapodya prolifera (strain JEL478) TaxID=1344416 RepID=A0A138ZXJ9_GONPJ|nr:hypothetical protein M427DRAFT_75834 [Gonapodya prolifera JEL478]|eukprot:KXS09204.1 hypothetical protein M427DRAFT_75834 [Gonapodya prolifera JEL478]
MDSDAVLPLAAVATTLALFGTSIVSARRYIATSSTAGESHIPFLAQFANCSLWIKYALATADPPVLIVNLAGAACSLYAAHSFWSASTHESRQIVEKHLAIAVVALVVALYYVKAWDPDALGFFAASGSIAMFASPLAGLATAISTKSTLHMSLPLSLASTVVPLLWTLYGLSRTDPVMYVPNAIATVLGGIGLALFAVYGRR